MMKKDVLLIIVGLFLLGLPIVIGIKTLGEGEEFRIQKNHLGAQGDTGNGTTFTSRFTLTYNQPSNRFGNSSDFTANVGWFSIPKQPKAGPTGSGRGSSGGGGGGRSRIYGECEDRQDNDGDGLIDMQDPDCDRPLGTEGLTCTPSWVCASWSTCGEGRETRECEDLNACGTEVLKPTEQRSCEVVVTATCSDRIQNQGERGIDCGGPCASCVVEVQTPAPRSPPKKPATVEAAGFSSIILAALIMGILILSVGGFVFYHRREQPISFAGTPQQQLLQAIKLNLSKGFSQDQVQQQLVDIGWSPHLIDQAFATYQGTPNTRTSRHMHQLIQSIEQHVTQGHSEQEIKHELGRLGWDATLVQQGFYTYHSRLIEHTALKGLAAGEPIETIRKIFIDAGWDQGMVNDVFSKLRAQ